MAKGSEDWSKRIDLVAQTVAEVTVFPFTGSRVITNVIVTQNVASSYLLASVVGRGVINGIALTLYSTESCKSAKFKFDVNGADFPFTPTLEQLKIIGLTSRIPYEFWLQCYDDTNFYYNVQGVEGINFDEGFKLYYTLSTTAVHLINARIYYTLL